MTKLTYHLWKGEVYTCRTSTPEEVYAAFELVSARVKENIGKYPTVIYLSYAEYKRWVFK